MSILVAFVGNAGEELVGARNRVRIFPEGTQKVISPAHALPRFLTRFRPRASGSDLVPPEILKMQLLVVRRNDLAFQQKVSTKPQGAS